MSNIVLTKCQHPVRIINKSTGEYMFVDCGHCANCRYNYRKKWQHRLELESRSSVSTLFFTLTYSNDFIPTVLDSGDGYLHSQAGSRAESVNLSDYFNEPSKVFIPYVKSQTCGHEYEMGVCSKRDVQLFLKRLRRIISYDKDSLLRAYVSLINSFVTLFAQKSGPKPTVHIIMDYSFSNLQLFHTPSCRIIYIRLGNIVMDETLIVPVSLAMRRLTYRNTLRLILAYRLYFRLNRIVLSICSPVNQLSVCLFSAKLIAKFLSTPALLRTLRFLTLTPKEHSVLNSHIRVSFSDITYRSLLTRLAFLVTRCYRSLIGLLNSVDMDYENLTQKV